MLCYFLFRSGSVLSFFFLNCTYIFQSTKLLTTFFLIYFYFYFNHIFFFFLLSFFFLPPPVQAELLSLRTGVSCLLCGHGGVLLCGAADGDGGRVATAGKDAEIRIWDTVSGECVEKLQGHTETVSALCFGRKTADLLVSGANDNTIKIWRREDGKLILFLSPVFMKKNYLFILFYLFHFCYFILFFIYEYCRENACCCNLGITQERHQHHCNRTK